jgi:hypothetical protein
MGQAAPVETLTEERNRETSVIHCILRNRAERSWCSSCGASELSTDGLPNHAAPSCDFGIGRCSRAATYPRALAKRYASISPPGGCADVAPWGYRSDHCTTDHRWFVGPLEGTCGAPRSRDVARTVEMICLYDVRNVTRARRHNSMATFPAKSIEAAGTHGIADVPGTHQAPEPSCRCGVRSAVAQFSQTRRSPK